MAAVETFDLTAAGVVAQYLPQVTLSADSTPTSTQAGNLLTEILADVNGVLRGIGITPGDVTSATATATDYEWIRATVALGFVGVLLEAQSSGRTEVSKRYSDQYMERLKRLRKRPEECVPDSFSATTTSTQPRSHVGDESMSDDGTFNDDATPPFRYTDHW